jgi:HPt (histidine-containing phosphotransfer) domain-containing protein
VKPEPLDDLGTLYRRALVARLAALVAARAALEQTGAPPLQHPGTGIADAPPGADEPDAAAIAQGLAHALRGSGATYGFPEVSRAAAAVEDASRDRLAERMDELIEVVRITVRSGGEGSAG